MRSRKHLKNLTLLAVAMLVCAPVWAQRSARGLGPGPRVMQYETSKEVRLKGKVVGIQETDCPECPRGTKGTHITLKTSDQSFDVRLGPTSYLADQTFTVAKNDQVEVTGSKVKQGHAEVILAREVKKGDKTIKLRDSQGAPAWARGMQRR